MKKLALAAALMSLSAGSALATTYDPVNDATTTTLSVAPTNTYQYTGTVDNGGVDTWTINLTRAAGIVFDITTAQGSGAINPVDLPTAISTLNNITSAELVDASNNVLASGAAVYTLIPLGGANALLSSTVSFAYNQLLNPGTYSLKIYGDAATAYSGSLSVAPLPGAAWLFGSGLLGFMLLSNRRKV